jgi:hypothetical protein
MEATVPLADWAEAINGKLYVQGGGWTQVIGANGVSCALAIRLAVAWDEANMEHHLAVALRDEDGALVEAEPGNPVAVGVAFEVGRPPGVRAGSDLHFTTALKFTALALPVGRYAFVLEIDGAPLGRATTFDVV